MRQWHERSPEEQDRMGARYKENMRILDGSQIGYENKGTTMEIRAPGMTATLYPYFGRWIMHFQNGNSDSGSSFRGFIQAYRRFQ